MIAGLLIVYFVICFLLYFYCKKNSFLYGFIILFVLLPYIFLNCNPYSDYKMDKVKLLEYVPDKYKPVTRIYDRNSSYNFPFILKPNNCSGFSHGVAIIRTQEQLETYLQVHKEELVIQEYIDSKHEVGLLYEKNPLSNEGNIISIIERKFSPGEVLVPFEVSQENDNIEIKKTIENYYDRFRDLTPEKTEKLEKVIQSISADIPNFNAGRYDIRFNSVDDLMEGKNFYILEVNGCNGFDLQKDLYFFIDPRSIAIQLRFVFVRIFYGLTNILTLNGTNPVIMFQIYYNTFICRSWERLFTID